MKKYDLAIVERSDMYVCKRKERTVWIMRYKVGFNKRHKVKDSYSLEVYSASGDCLSLVSSRTHYIINTKEKLCTREKLLFNLRYMSLLKYNKTTFSGLK